VLTTDVIWSVNGTVGGNSAVGTITQSGIYKAPNIVNSSPVQYTVRATSNDDPNLFDEAVVTVLSAGTGYQFRTDGVSVRYGTPSNTSRIYSQDGVSVRYGTPSDTLSVYAKNEVSVGYGASSGMTSVFPNNAVSVGSGPYLTSLSPGTVARGSTITLNINGISLNNASDIRFFRVSNGDVETGITASNISVTGQGTTLTAMLTVNANVSVGQFIVVVVTPLGATVRNPNTTNTIQVQ
jgi:hypothetical protein